VNRDVLGTLFATAVAASRQSPESFLCIGEGAPGSDRSPLQPPQFPACHALGVQGDVLADVIEGQ
jgi:hypothetical protein